MTTQTPAFDSAQAPAHDFAQAPAHDFAQAPAHGSAQAPKLRFPEFSDNWEMKLLEDIAVRGSGHTPSKAFESYYDGNIPWVSLADSKSLDDGFIEKTTNTISKEGIKNSSAVLHPMGSVLLSRDAGIGKSAVMKVDMAVSQHFIVWRPIEGKLSNWFLYYKLQIHKPEFERIAIGSTIKTIGLPYFKILSFNFPQLPEQTKIANFLTAIDEKIQALKQKKTLLEQYKKGIMQQIFSQELRFKRSLSDAAGVPVEGNDDGADFDDWEEKSLGEVSEKISDGLHSTPNYDENGEYYFVNGNNLVNGKIQFNENTKKVNHEEYLKHKKDLNEKSILISINGTIGSLARFNGENIILGKSACYINVKMDTDELFIYYLLHSSKVVSFFISELTGSTIKNLSLTTIKNCKFQLPSLPEQQKIANFLTAIDEKIEKVSQQISSTETYKKGLLQQMFC